MTTPESGKLFDHLGKVRALLAKAESSEFPAEKAALWAKAQQMMKDHRLNEEQLIAAGDPTAAMPIQLLVDLCQIGSPVIRWHMLLAHLVAEHVGARVLTYRYHAERKGPAAVFVGYESDVRVAVELLTSAQLVFSEKLEPQVDPSKTDRENIYRLRSSGQTRQDVAVMLWGREEGAKASAHAKVGRIYKEECAVRGETPALDGKGINLDVFRRAYSREFYWTLENRLEMARQHADREGGTMVLHGRKERVDEAFYGFFPDMRPKPVTEEVAKTTPAKTVERKRRGPTKAQQRAAHREYNSAAANAGHSAGAGAGREVDLGRNGSKVRRVEESVPVPRQAIEG